MSASYDIFDVHQHYGLIEGISGHVAASGDSSAAADLETRLLCMAALGIRQTALMPAHSYARPNGMADTRRINDGLAAYRRQDPDHIRAVFGTVEPRCGDAGLEEIDRMALELGFQGVSWHHRQQGLPIDHAIMHRFVERMMDRGLVPVVHCYARADLEEIWRLRRLAEAFPDVSFLCLDAMTHQQTFEEVLAAGARAANIVIETASTVLGPEGVERGVRELGAERLLLGTNTYSNRLVTHNPGVSAVLQARISEADRALVLGGAARRLLRV
jgi:predicted TIM-barrel fold metal-dependent hydrolase